MGNTENEPHPHVRLIRCHHGNYHLMVGPVTLRLTEDELAYVGRAILAMSENHPALANKLAVDRNAEGTDPA